MRKYIKPTAWVNSKQADEVAEFYTRGHGVRETAEHFGISTVQVNNLAKARGLTNGRDWRAVANENRSHEAEQRIIEKAAERGFEYLGGYESKTGKVRIRCLKCGHEIERAVYTIKEGKTFCPECKKAETRERRESERRQRKAEQEQKIKEREAERIKKNPLGLSSYQIEREKKLDEVFTCKVCGKEYTPRQYIESTGGTTYSNPGYCSKECRDAHNKQATKESHKGRQDSHRHRAKKNGCEYDSSINLKWLIKRDGLRCAICGEMCEPEDHRWQYAGPLYPSMDHIIPMDKGGRHVPENVQVAHIICNSIKGNMVITNESKSERLAITCREAVRKYQRGFQGTGNNTRKIDFDNARENRTADTRI